MKKLKLRLEALREEIELLDLAEQSLFKGGTGNYGGYDTWNDFVAAIHAGYVQSGVYLPMSGGYGGYGGGYTENNPPIGWSMFVEAPPTGGGYGGGYGGSYGSYGGYGSYGSGPGDPVIEVGPITSSGVSTSVNFNNYGQYVPAEGQGIFGGTASVNGNVGVGKNSDGEWVVSASFSVTPPVSFGSPGARGSIDVYVDGEFYQSFSVGSPDNPNGTIYPGGTIPLSGGIKLPSSFGPGSEVSIKSRVGATNDTGVGIVSTTMSDTTTLTVPNYH